MQRKKIYFCVYQTLSESDCEEKHFLMMRSFDIYARFRVGGWYIIYRWLHNVIYSGFISTRVGNIPFPARRCKFLGSLNLILMAHADC